MKFLKNNYLLIIGILIIGIYSLSTQLIFEKKLGENYKGIYFSATDAELYYTSRIQEIKDGYYGMGNSHLYESKTDPYLIPPVGEIIMVGFGKFFNLTTPQIMIYGSRFFFPVLIWLAMYFFILVLQKDKKIAFLISLAIFLCSNLIYNPQDLINIFKGSGSFTFSPYLRPINPQISSLFFFSFLISFYLSLDKKKVYLWILSALFFGLSFYIYFYTWAFIITFIGLFVLFFIWKKKFDLLKITIKVLFGGIIVSLPYWFMLFRAFQTPQFKYSVNNQGMTMTHALILSKVALLTIVLYWLTFKILKLHENLSHFFLLSLSLTTTIVINQQIITGRELYHGHFHWYYNVPIFIIVSIICLDLLIKEFLPKFKNIIFSLLVILVIYNGALTYYNSFIYRFDRYAQLQKYGPIVDWVNNNLLKDEVVVADDLILDSIIPAYTSANVYLAEEASWYFAPQERIEHNYFIYLWMKGISIKEIDKYLIENKIEISTMSSLDLPGKHYICIECITPEMIQYLSQGYTEFSKSGFLNELNKYKADYIISESNILKLYSSIKPINEINGFIIYKIN